MYMLGDYLQTWINIQQNVVCRIDKKYIYYTAAVYDVFLIGLDKE